MNEKYPEVSGQSSSKYWFIPKNSKLYHFFGFIDKHYDGNVVNLVQTVSSITPLIQSISRKHKNKIRKIIDVCSAAIPATIHGIDLYTNLNQYVKYVTHGDKAFINKKVAFLFDKLETNGMSERCITSISNINIAFFLFTCPKIDNVKIIDYFYNLEPFDIKNEINESGNYYMLFEYMNKKFIMRFYFRKNSGNTYLDSLIDVVYDPDISDIHDVDNIKRVILKSYINHFKIKYNTLNLHESIYPKPRKKVQEHITQIDVHKLAAEMKLILKRGGRRGYVLLGKQGVGKTSIINKLEELLTDTVIVHISPSQFWSSGSIIETFNTVKSLQPVICIIEDLDGLNLQEKNEKVSTFINEIDDSNNDLNIIIIVTINDTNLVHETVINRPGRFEEIIEIKSPQTKQEVQSVLESRFKKSVKKYFKVDKYKLPKMDKQLIEACLNNKFTQADLACNIIDKILFSLESIENLNNKVFNEKFKKAIDNVIKTKNTLLTYSFSDKKTEIPPQEEVCCENPKLFKQ